MASMNIPSARIASISRGFRLQRLPLSLCTMTVSRFKNHRFAPEIRSKSFRQGLQNQINHFIESMDVDPDEMEVDPIWMDIDEDVKQLIRDTRALQKREFEDSTGTSGTSVTSSSGKRSATLRKVAMRDAPTNTENRAVLSSLVNPVHLGYNRDARHRAENVFLGNDTPVLTNANIGDFLRAMSIRYNQFQQIVSRNERRDAGHALFAYKLRLRLACFLQEKDFISQPLVERLLKASDQLREIVDDFLHLVHNGFESCSAATYNTLTS